MSISISFQFITKKITQMKDGYKLRWKEEKHRIVVHYCFHLGDIFVAVGPSDTGKSLMAKLALSTVGLEGAIFVSVTSTMMTTLMRSGIIFVFNDPETTTVQDLNAFKNAIWWKCKHAITPLQQWQLAHRTRIAKLHSPLLAWKVPFFVSITSTMMTTLLRSGIIFVFNDPETTSVQDSNPFKIAINENANIQSYPHSRGSWPIGHRQKSYG